MPKIPRIASNERGFAPILVLVIVLAAAGLIASTTIRTTQQHPAGHSQSVLGDNTSEADQQSQEAAQHAQEQQQEQQKHQQEQTQEAQQHASEQSNQAPIQSTIPQINFQSEGTQQEMEIQTPDGQHIHYKVEDNGAVQIEGEQGQLHFKYASESGQIKSEIENELGQEGIKIATQSGHPTIIKNNIAALSDFPITFDATSHQLSVTTSQGNKILATLPDQAVRGLLSANVITQLNQTASGSAQLSGNTSVKIETRDDQLVYQVEGNKTYKVFGIIPIATPVTAYVSVDSGNLVTQNQPLIANLFSLISSK